MFWESGASNSVWRQFTKRKKSINSSFYVLCVRLFFVIRVEYLRESYMKTKYFLIFLMSKNLARKQQHISWSPDSMGRAESFRPAVLLFGMHHEKKSPPFLLSLYIYTYTYWYFGEFFRKPKIQAFHKRCQIMAAEMTVTLLWNYYSHSYQIQL